MKRFNFKHAVILESIVLLAVVLLFRFWAFDMLKYKVLPDIIALHIFMIGATVLIFAAFALTLKRAWKTHGKYVIPLVVFLVFGILMTAAAGDISL